MNETWNALLLLREPDEIFEIFWHLERLSFVVCFAEEALLLGNYLIADRLFDSVIDPLVPGRSRRRRSRASPQWFPISHYQVAVRSRPKWARG